MHVALVGGLLVAALVGSQPPGEEFEARRRAEARYQEAVADFEAGRFEAAAVGFDEAHGLFPSARLLFNLALAREKAGDLVAAAEALSRYIGAADRDQAKDAASYLTRIEKELKRTHGHIRVVFTPAGTRFLLDGQLRRSPWSGWLLPGEYPLEVRDPSALAASHRVTVVLGQTNEVDLQAVPRPAELVVRSTPDRARVLLDGERLGHTPLRWIGVRPGLRDMELRADEHEPWRRRVMVGEHGPTVVDATLRRAPDSQAPVRIDIDTVLPLPPPTDWQTPTGWAAVGLGLVTGAVGAGLQTRWFLEASSQTDGPPLPAGQQELWQDRVGTGRNAALYSASAVLVGAGIALLFLSPEASP